MVAMKTIMTEALSEAADYLEGQDTSSPEKLGAAVEGYIKTVWAECSSVVFNGDGYSDEWHVEAERRGLPNLKTTADALPVFLEPQYAELFGKYGVLSERELHSRYEVYAEQYIASVNVESNLVVEIAKTVVFPAAIRYQGELALSLANLKAVGIETDSETLKKITGLIADLQSGIGDLEALKAAEHDQGDVGAHCMFIKDKVLPQMLAIRAVVDELESIVADDLWPLPTFQEMLFIK